MMLARSTNATSEPLCHRDGIRLLTQRHCHAQSCQERRDFLENRKASSLLLRAHPAPQSARLISKTLSHGSRVCAPPEGSDGSDGDRNPTLWRTSERSDVREPALPPACDVLRLSAMPASRSGHHRLLCRAAAARHALPGLRVHLIPLGGVSVNRVSAVRCGCDRSRETSTSLRPTPASIRASPASR